MFYELDAGHEVVVSIADASDGFVAASAKKDGGMQVCNWPLGQLLPSFTISATSGKSASIMHDSRYSVHTSAGVSASGGAMCLYSQDPQAAPFPPSSRGGVASKVSPGPERPTPTLSRPGRVSTLVIKGGTRARAVAIITPVEGRAEELRTVIGSQSQSGPLRIHCAQAPLLFVSSINLPEPEARR